LRPDMHPSWHYTIYRDLAFFILLFRPPPSSTLFPYTTLFRSVDYVHGNDTSDLWFSEGVTSTYGELALLRAGLVARRDFYAHVRSEEHTSELQSRGHIVCRLLLEKKKTRTWQAHLSGVLLQSSRRTDSAQAQGL